MVEPTIAADLAAVISPDHGASRAGAEVEVRLPFAEAPSGRLVGIADVERGAACGCVCPGCGRPVIARKGDIMRHHFAHAASAECMTALESMAHKLGKQIVADAGMLWVPGYGEEGAPLIREMCVAADRVESEKAIGPIRPDLLFYKSGRTLAVEILVTHTPEPSKIAAFRAAGVAAVEIDLSEIRPEEITAAYVIQHAPRRWLFHPVIDLAQARTARKQAAAAWRETRRLRDRVGAERAELAAERERVERLTVNAAAAQALADRLAAQRIEWEAEGARVAAARTALASDRSVLEAERSDVAGAKRALHAEISASRPLLDEIFKAWPDATVTQVVDNAL